jgi:hypothetical protein
VSGTDQASPHLIPLRFVVFAVWFASAATRVFITQQHHHDFICPLKTTRKVALRRAQKPQGRSTRVETRDLEAQAPREVYLEGVDFPRVLGKQVFRNEAGSVGMRSLVSRETTLSVDDLTTPSHERWQVECSHQSLTQNGSLAQSPPPPSPRKPPISLLPCGA